MAYDQDSIDTDIVILSDPDSDIFCDGESSTPALHSGILPVYQRHSASVQPASHHALSCAYKDLKRRFNDLESKYKHLSRHIKCDQNSSPIMASNYHSSGANKDSSAAYNSQSGNLGQFNGEILQSRYHEIMVERDELRQQREEWKLKYEELDHRYALNVQKETQMSDIWERIHGRSAPGSAVERLQLSQLSQDNSSLSQKLHSTEQRLQEQTEENSQLSLSIKQVEERASIGLRKQQETEERLSASKQRYERLNEELDQLRSDLQRHITMGLRDGSMEDKYLQSVGVAVAEGRQETIRKKKKVPTATLR